MKRKYEYQIAELEYQKKICPIYLNRFTQPKNCRVVQAKQHRGGIEVE